MCGRFTLIFTYEDLKKYFQLAEMPSIEPRFNIAPSQDVLAIRMEGGIRRAAMLHWGLIPYWAKDPKIGNRTINARAETVQTMPSFRAAFRKRRCLIPASGFFEWSKMEGTGKKEKQPFYITLKDGKPMVFAGLWERWHDEKAGQEIESCTILTTQANELVGKLHNRMPVILGPESFDRWLVPEESGTATLLPLLRPVSDELLAVHPVSKYVNTPAHQGEECIEPIETLA